MQNRLELISWTRILLQRLNNKYVRLRALKGAEHVSDTTSSHEVVPLYPKQSETSVTKYQVVGSDVDEKWPQTG